MMQSPLTVGAVLLGSLLVEPAIAQDNVAKKEAKLAEAWLKNADWILDYDKALEAAEKSGKPIFAYFTRSYAP